MKDSYTISLAILLASIDSEISAIKIDTKKKDTLCISGLL